MKLSCWNFDDFPYQEGFSIMLLTVFNSMGTHRSYVGALGLWKVREVDRVSLFVSKPGNFAEHQHLTHVFCFHLQEENSGANSGALIVPWSDSILQFSVSSPLLPKLTYHMEIKCWSKTGVGLLASLVFCSQTCFPLLIMQNLELMLAQQRSFWVTMTKGFGHVFLCLLQGAEALLSLVRPSGSQRKVTEYELMTFTHHLRTQCFTDHHSCDSRGHINWRDDGEIKQVRFCLISDLRRRRIFP